MGLEIEVVNVDGRVCVRVQGEVDLNSSPDLRKAILEGIESGAEVEVDLSGAAYMDSSGVATLVEGLKSSSNKDQSFSLLSPSDAVMRVLQLARLDSLFTIRDER